MKPVIFLRSLSLFTFLFLFQGCASILSKSSYPVHIRTQPAGADISITNKKGVEIFKGKSPATVSLKPGAGYFSRAEYQVKLTMGGYDEKILPVHFKLNGWYFGNLLIGGLLGMLIIDPATGAMWIIDKNTGIVNETLEPSKPPVVMNMSPELRIIDIKDVPEHLRASLHKIN
jgi:hypothetical protein